MSKYDYVYIFKKEADLLPWLECQKVAQISEKARAHYVNKREITLRLLLRYDHGVVDGRTVTRRICRIRCPINPIPIRGEFEVVSAKEITRFLSELGWTFKEKFRLDEFE